MHGEKMLSFGSGENATELAVKVSTYCQGNRLYVGLYNQGDAGLEPFSNLTVNLPYLPAEFNEGYINWNGSQNLLEFIERHQLGMVLPEKGYSGYCKFAKVAFDLDKLAELDPAGMEEYRSQSQTEKGSKAQKKDGIPKKDKQPKKKEGMER